MAVAVVALLACAPEAEAVLDGERVGEVVTLEERVPDVVTVRDEVCEGDIEAEAETE